MLSSSVVPYKKLAQGAQHNKTWEKRDVRDFKNVKCVSWSASMEFSLYLKKQCNRSATVQPFYCNHSCNRTLTANHVWSIECCRSLTSPAMGHVPLPLEFARVHQFGNVCLAIHLSPVSSGRLVVNNTRFPFSRSSHRFTVAVVCRAYLFSTIFHFTTIIDGRYSRCYRLNIWRKSDLLLSGLGRGSSDRSDHPPDGYRGPGLSNFLGKKLIKCSVTPLSIHFIYNGEDIEWEISISGEGRCKVLNVAEIS